jgi:AcrR family transcriptional regulator
MHPPEGTLDESAPASHYESYGRVDQKRRTRETIKRAAARLAADGATPTMADIADASGVSRSSAYRYFPSVEALMAEVILDATVSPDIATIDAAADSARSAEQRLAAVIRTDHAVVIRHEQSFRAAIRSMLADEAAHDRMPRRPGNRLRYLARAVEPLRERLTPEQHDRLVAALALTVGIESRIVLADIAGLDDTEAEHVKHWVAAALLDAALAQAST